MTATVKSERYWKPSESPTQKRNKIALSFGRGYRYFTNAAKIDVPYLLANLKRNEVLVDARSYPVAWNENNQIMSNHSSIFVLDLRNSCLRP